MNIPTLRYVVIAGALMLFSGGACNCNGSNSGAAESDQDEKAAETRSAEESEEGDEEGAEKEEETVEDAPPEDLYPGMEFSRLEPAERKTFVAVAEQELCPCADANASLHKCLKEDSAHCALAKRSATVIARAIRSGLSRDDVLDKLAEFLEESKREHQFSFEIVPKKGPEDAPVQIVEFADFQCPHCKRASELMGEIVEQYEGEVVHYFKHFPLSSHGQARMAARAATAAQMQGKFWPMHDLLFENQKGLSKRKVEEFARRLGLNFSKFQEDMASEEIGSVVERDRSEGLEANVSGTPALFINGRRYVGSLNKQGLSEAIEAELASSEGSSDGENGESAESEESGEEDETGEE